MSYNYAAKSFHTETLYQTFFEKNAVLFQNGHCVFELPVGGLEATYAVHLRLIGKRIVDFLLVIMNFSPRCWLRANIDWKSPFLKG